MSLRWQGDLDSYKASVYTSTAPYMEKRLVVSGTSIAGMRRLQEDVEQRARSEGYLPLDECPEDVQKYWFKVHLDWVMYDVLRHLAS